MTIVSINRARPPVDHRCQVIRVTPLSESTFEVELRATDLVLRYRAGQHLQLELDVHGDGQRHSLSYSIANSFDPAAPKRLQLFIQNDSTFARQVLARLRKLSAKASDLTVKLPMGRAFLQTDLELPHLLVAAGSGISKIKCLTEEILRQTCDPKVSIYWSNRNPNEFYLLDQFENWASRHSNLVFTPILESTNSNWSGRAGYLYEVIRQDSADLSDTRAYLCGSPRMVYGTIDRLQALGLQERHCYSDVLEYAPRDQTRTITASGSISSAAC